MIKKILNIKSYLKSACCMSIDDAGQAGLKSSTNFSNRKNNTGFSMVELLVTISILVLVSAVIFFNNAQFNNHIIVENLAYEISLAIRQAQSYGVQVRETEGSFNEGYGIYFDKDSEQFFIFADSYPEDNPNFVYDLDSDEVVDTLRMTGGNKIDDLCIEKDSTRTCSLTDISIAFLRPNPNAIIKTSSVEDTEYDTVEIQIVSPKGIKKKIFVNRVGQISVQSVE